jgi:hydrogenase-4 component B
MRRWAARGEREALPWTGGFGKPPVWLPFGDPATQPSATGFAEPVQRALGFALLGNAGIDPSERYILAPLNRLHVQVTRLAEWVRRATVRQRLAFVFAALVMFLLVLGLGQNG